MNDELNQCHPAKEGLQSGAQVCLALSTAPCCLPYWPSVRIRGSRVVLFPPRRG